MQAAESPRILEPKPVLILLLTAAGSVGWVLGGLLAFTFWPFSGPPTVAALAIACAVIGGVIGLSLGLCLALSTRTRTRILIYPVCSIGILLIAIPGFELVSDGRLMSARELGRMVSREAWTIGGMVLLPGAGLLWAHLRRRGSALDGAVGFAILGAISNIFFIPAMNSLHEAAQLLPGALAGLVGGMAQFGALRGMIEIDRRMRERG